MNLKYLPYFLPSVCKSPYRFIGGRTHISDLASADPGQVKREKQLKKMTTRHFSLLLLAVVVVSASAVAADPSNDCVYTLYVQTGSIIKAGTDSKISVTLGDSKGKSVWIPNLRDWGLMGPNHDYYERGNLDIFTGRGPCISSPICRLNLTSDGSGDHHGWYCDYVEVTSTGPHKACSQSIFYVEQWLATDAPPYELSAVLDGCKMEATQLREGHNRPFVAGRASASA